MTLLVRNEEDILRAHLDYHYSRGVDFIIATDNLSVDATTDILREYEEQGRLRLILEDGDDYSQDVWVTRMARLAATQHEADWVINSDADEFWWPTRANLKEELSEYSSGIGIVYVPRHNFVCRPDYGEEDFWKTMTYRQRVAVNEAGSMLPPKALHRAKNDVTVAQGNHGVENAGGRPVASDGIEILHFPIRRWEQFARKVKYGGGAYCRNKRLPLQVGKRWRMQFDLLRQGALENYFTNLVFTEQKLTDALSNGTLLEDARLARYMSSLSA